jgi:hypothetical protein
MEVRTLHTHITGDTSTSSVTMPFPIALITVTNLEVGNLQTLLPACKEGDQGINEKNDEEIEYKIHEGITCGMRSAVYINKCINCIGNGAKEHYPADNCIRYKEDSDAFKPRFFHDF